MQAVNCSAVAYPLRAPVGNVFTTPLAEDLCAAQELVNQIFDSCERLRLVCGRADAMQGAGAQRLIRQFMHQRGQKESADLFDEDAGSNPITLPIAIVCDPAEQQHEEWRRSTLRLLLEQVNAVLIRKRQETEFNTRAQKIARPTPIDAPAPLWKRSAVRALILI